jgi:deoxyribodipyrimidine photo-lyase
MALTEAARDPDGVVGVFVLDPRWFGPTTGKIGPHQATFWLESLRELKGALEDRGIPLVIRTDADPVRALLSLARECEAERITFNKEYEPSQMAMDDRLTHEAADVNVAVAGFKDAVIFEEEEILTGGGGREGGGGPYGVFSPYKRAYLKKLGGTVSVGEVVRKNPRAFQMRSEELPTVTGLGFEEVVLEVKPGEKAGAQLLARFCENGMAAYKEKRDLPALGLHGLGTSRLSAHLNAGTVSIRQAMRAALDQPQNEGTETWISELIWREFYRMVLFHHPETVSQPFQKQYSDLRWTNDPAMIAAWSEGRTGYPLVDAAMKQIRATGFMHNRLRMIAAMFLSKDMDVHWVVGERLFRQWLMDYDESCNVGGWQWAASTGTDAAPYFRIMNPVLQSERFDPEGEFLRHYLPALRKVPTKYIHAPWEMPPEVQASSGCVIGKDYPAPIVDHAVAKARAVEKFRRK